MNLKLRNRGLKTAYVKLNLNRCIDIVFNQAFSTE